MRAGECLAGLRLLEDASADVVITDPPYEADACQCLHDSIEPSDHQRLVGSVRLEVLAQRRLDDALSVTSCAAE
jgi:hypothetical protein